MTDEAKYEAMIEKGARAMYERVAGDGGWNHADDAVKIGFCADFRAAAEAIGLKPGCVVVNVLWIGMI